MLSPSLTRLLLIAVLGAALLAYWCQKPEAPEPEAPDATVATPPEVATSPETGEAGEVQGESEAVAAARTLGALTDSPVVTTASGLQYIDVEVGEGEVAKAGDNVSVHYTGWLVNGKKFDGSRDHGGPLAFVLGAGRVIKGWDEGVAGMKAGGVRKLTIPAKLGYGERGAGGIIPPNATLIFEVELLEIL